MIQKYRKKVHCVRTDITISEYNFKLRLKLKLLTNLILYIYIIYILNIDINRYDVNVFLNTYTINGVGRLGSLMDFLFS